MPEEQVAVIGIDGFAQGQVCFVPGNRLHFISFVVLENQGRGQGFQIHFVEVHKVGIPLVGTEIEGFFVFGPPIEPGPGPFPGGQVLLGTVLIHHVDVVDLIPVVVHPEEHALIFRKIGDGED